MLDGFYGLMLIAGQADQEGFEVGNQIVVVKKFWSILLQMFCRLLLVVANGIFKKVWGSLLANIKVL